MNSILLLAFSALTFVVGLELESNSNKFVKLDLSKPSDSTGSGLIKRYNENNTPIRLDHGKDYYSVVLEIGTPPQKIEVLLDTGSSDLWIMANDSFACSGSYEYMAENTKYYACDEHGTFVSKDSSTFHSNGTDFGVTYGDKTSVTGTWAMDTVRIGNLNITSASFGLANDANSTMGILGIGLPAGESTYAGSNSFYQVAKNVTQTGQIRYKSHSGDILKNGSYYQYNNLPMMMKQSGNIDYIAYSIFLHDPDVDRGSILFGALNRTQYTGNLYTLPIKNTLEDIGIEKPVSFSIDLYGLGVTKKGSKETVATTNMTALLDTGTTFTYLPVEIIEGILEKFYPSYSSLYGLYFIDDCSAGNDYNLIFDFGGVHISTPMSNFIAEERDKCYLTMMESVGGAILGQTFFKSAYVVYDLEKYEISLAQGNIEDTKDKKKHKNDDTADVPSIQVFSTGIPGAIKPVQAQSRNISTSTFMLGGDIFTLTDSSFYSQTSDITSAKSKNKKNAAVLSTPFIEPSLLMVFLSFFV